MYKHIYDKFKDWYRGGSIYIYSDPHFNDPDKFMYNPTYPGDEEQVKAINKVVKKLDTLILLGDIGDKEFLKKINGYKVLILGNHDTGGTTYKEYVDEVYEGPLFISEKILLSHEPINLPYVLNIHGHTHSKYTINTPISIDVCAEKINYTPINLTQIIKNGILKEIKGIHRTFIDIAGGNLC